MKSVNKILAVDDHELVRKGLRYLMEETPDLRITAEASNPTDALKELRKQDFDLVIVDISMQSGDGLDLLKSIKNLQPQIPVLILSMHSEKIFATRALKIGAHGYLTKDSAPGNILVVIRKLLNGELYFPQSEYVTPDNFMHKADIKLPHEKLSQREFQIMCMMSSGKGVTTIANELFLSVKTVSTHRTHILRKLRLNNNAEVMQYAVNNHLV
jgi:two-component system, NarL family, invasion response regulator UvrY